MRAVEGGRAAPGGGLTRSGVLFLAGATALAAGFDHPELGMGNGAGQALFDEYKSLGEVKGVVKVFVLSPGDAVVYATGDAYAKVRAQALESCRGKSTLNPYQCAVFAVGDTIVWDRPPEETAAIVERYEERAKGGEAAKASGWFKIISDVMRDAFSSP